MPKDPLATLLDALARSDVPAAIDALEAAEAAGPSPTLHTLAARLCRRRFRLEEARERALRAVRDGGDIRSAALAELAEIELADGRPSVALDVVSDVGDDDDRRVRCARGRALAGMGRADEARRILTALCDDDARWRAWDDATVDAMATWAALVPPAEAATRLDRALASGVGGARLTWERARVDLRLGRFTAAARAMAATLASLPLTDPLRGPLAVELAVAERRRGKPAAARQILPRPGTPGVSNATLAEEEALLAEEGEADDALRRLHQALFRGRDASPRLELRLAAVREAARRGRWAEVDDLVDGIGEREGADVVPLSEDWLDTADALADHDDDTSREARLLCRLLDRAPDAVAQVRLQSLGVGGARVPVGPFDLDVRLGGGPMGEVWRARHHRHGAPVAVKVLTARSASRPRLLALFEAEIRSAAALDHPNVVRVLDAGRIGAGAEALTLGRWRAESPWFAMELRSGRTLESLRGLLAWSEVKGVLSDLLSALGHAHARGVVHLDVKPANVLVEADGPLSPRLADFGLAGLRGLAAGSVAGSPFYMAPEQLLGRTELLGPPADLYSLGCLAVELVQGRPPFDHPDPMVVRESHLWHAPPPLNPARPVAAGFEAWVSHLLQKDPARRFDSAAHAAHALSGLVLDDDGPTRTTAETTWSPDAPTFVAEGVAEPTDPVPSGPRVPAAALVVPLRWREQSHPRDAGLLAAGLGLASLRRPPLVGRSAERERLWSSLRAAVASRRPAIVAVAGPPGIGRAALLRWLAEHAAEDAGVRTFVADASDRDPLLGVVPEPPDDLDDSLRGGLAAWRGGHAPLAAVAGLVARSLAAECAERPGVLVLGGAALAWPGVDALLHALAAEDAPLWVGVRADPGQTVAAATATIELPTMSPAELRRVLRDHLPLSPSLEEEIVRRSSGNPGLAVEAVLRLSDGRLVPGRRGLRLRRGHRMEFPDGLLAAWRARLEAALAPLPPAAADLVALVAALGPHAQTAALHDAADGLTDDALVRQVLARGVLERRGDGLALAGGLPEATATDAAQDRGSLRRLAAAAARALASARLDPAREGRLRLIAGDTTGALGPLLQGARTAYDRSELSRAAELLDTREVAASRLGLDADDPAGIEPLVLRAHTAALEGDPQAEDRAFRAMERRVAGSARRSDHAELAVRLGYRALVSGDLHAADRHFAEAVDHFVADDHPRAALAYGYAADVARLLGRTAEAAERLRRGLERAARSGDGRRDRITLELRLGAVHLQQGERDEAQAILMRSHTAAVAEGLHLHAANAALALGDDARHRGDLGMADAWYERAFQSTSSGYLRGLADMNGAMVLIESGALARAEERLARAARSVTPPRYRAFATIIRVPLVAHADEATFAAALAEATVALDVPGIRSEVDVPWCLERAAAAALRAGHASRAETLSGLAAGVWREMGRPDDADRALATVRTGPGPALSASDPTPPRRGA